MNILLLGSGAREHALAWKLAQSHAITQDGGTLWAAPGNPGIARHARLVALDAGDHEAVAEFCARESIGLVVIGPEAPLVDGLADSLRGAGIPVFGPSREAARLEGSKGFTKELCKRAGIPTAGYAIIGSRSEGRAALDRFAAPYVLKADGLAGGKGVVIAETREEAEAALVDMLGGAFGDAGTEVVIEEFMAGEEVSVFALTDGTTLLLFGTAQDHKRVGEGDTGPNTGGMGAYSPARVLTAALEEEVAARILIPTIRALAQAGTPYSGVLYAGLMLTDDGPKLVEYNCRFGDPECQVLMMRFTGDLADYLHACGTGRLCQMPETPFAEQAALTVVMAAEGYPGTPAKGGTISGLDLAEALDARVFQAATREREDGELFADGGRVLSITATGADIAEAQRRAYAAVGAVDFPSGFWRGDIGWREVGRLRHAPADTGQPSRKG